MWLAESETVSPAKYYNVPHGANRNLPSLASEEPLLIRLFVGGLAFDWLDRLGWLVCVDTSLAATAAPVEQ